MPWWQEGCQGKEKGVSKAPATSAGAITGSGRQSDRRLILEQCRQQFPGTANLIYQAFNFTDCVNIIVKIRMHQAAHHIFIEITQVARQVTALFKVQRILQPINNAYRAIEKAAFLGNIFSFDFAFDRRKGLDQTIKQHLNQLDTVGVGYRGSNVNIAVCIQGLDLSRNDLLPNAFEALLEALEKNKTLQMVSLAQNMILDRKDQQEKA